MTRKPMVPSLAKVAYDPLLCTSVHDCKLFTGTLLQNSLIFASSVLGKRISISTHAYFASFLTNQLEIEFSSPYHRVMCSELS